MFVSNGVRLNPAQIFEGKDGQTYLPGWMATASAEELAAAGVEIVDEPQRPDDRYYVVTQLDDGSYHSVPRELGAAIASLKQARIDMAFAEMQRRFSATTVTVPKDGVDHRYGCDEVTRQNISDINAAISRAPQAVTEPYYYFPKGETAPVGLSHDDFTAIFLAGLARGSEFYQVYFGHKAAIKAIDLKTPIDTYKAVEAYDFTTGYDEIN